MVAQPVVDVEQVLVFEEALRAESLLRELPDVPPPSAESPPGDATASGTPAEGGLTAREIEVLRLVAEGLGDKEIAQRLHLSVAAVKYHVSNILSKLAVSNRTEAATFALEHNLVPKLS